MRVALAGPVRFDELTDLVDAPLPDGVEPISGGSPVSALARTLHARGHEVVVASLAHGADTTTVRRGPRLELHIAPYRPRHRARDAFAAERHAVRDAVRRAGADVVHAHWSYEFALGALASGVPTVVTVRDWAPTILRHHRHPYRLVRLAMSALVLRRAPMLTATSPYLHERVVRWARGDVHLVPNAIADEDFVEELPPRGVATAPTIVAINNGWGERKNVASLLRAWPRIIRSARGARLRLVGSGYEPGGPAADFARSVGASDGIEFVGSLPYRDAMRVLAEGDLFVHPSREEAFGLVLVEAMARGVPVVAGARSGAVPWVCDGGRAGALTDVDDPAALADAVLRTLRDRRAAEARREHALRYARDRFSLGAVAGSYEQLYERVVGRAA